MEEQAFEVHKDGYRVFGLYFIAQRGALYEGVATKRLGQFKIKLIEDRNILFVIP